MSQSQDRIEEVVKNFLDKKIDDQIESVVNNRIEKRLSDIKWLVGNVAVIFATIFTVLIVGAYINFYNEKSSLDTYKKDLEQKLTGKSGTAKITLLNTDGSNLKGSMVHATQIRLHTDTSGRIEIYRLFFPVQYRNDGTGVPKKVFVKIWFAGFETSSFNGYYQNIDEEDKRFTIAMKIPYNQDSIMVNLPPTTNNTEEYIMESNKKPDKKVYDAKIKLFIGEEQSKSSEADFKLVIDDKTKFYDFSQTVEKKP